MNSQEAEETTKGQVEAACFCGHTIQIVISPLKTGAEMGLKPKEMVFCHHPSWQCNKWQRLTRPLLRAAFVDITRLVLTASRCGRYHHCLHFTEEDTEHAVFKYCVQVYTDSKRRPGSVVRGPNSYVTQECATPQLVHSTCISHNPKSVFVTTSLCYSH